MGFRGLMLAPPGAGKGTQGEILSDRLGLVHLATGDLLRHNAADRTEIGRRAGEFMRRGELVPDDLVIEMVFDRLDHMDPEEGFLLDGFPRTMAQATALYERGQVTGRTFHAVIVLDVDTEELVRRLLERGRHSNRNDDTPEVIRTRLDVYDNDTAPLIDFYSGRGILHHVDGMGTIDDVARRVQAVVDQVYTP